MSKVNGSNRGEMAQHGARTAGFNMGPRMLNAVRTPSALRTGATCCVVAPGTHTVSKAAALATTLVWAHPADAPSWPGGSAART